MVMCVTGGCNASHVTGWWYDVCSWGWAISHYGYGRCDRDVLLLRLPYPLLLLLPLLLNYYLYY